MSEDTLLSQSSTVARGDHHVDPDLVRRARIAAGQAATLLKNDGTLPLIRNESGALPKVALFGRTQRDWFAVGYGSGGDVNAPYLTDLAGSLAETGAVALDAELMDLYDELCADSPSLPGQARDQDVGDDPTDRDQAWGAWPTHYPEFELPDALVAAAARRNDVAVVVIGRAAGEDREATLEPGSYLLTDAERQLLAQVTAAFERTVVVVDTGNVMDLSWAQEFDVSALLIAWLGGMEGGRAIADVLTGAVEPGGRLTDTVAWRYEDYPSSSCFGDPEANDYVEDIFVGYRYFETFAPEAVQFPFGFGLGYTTFEIAGDGVDAGEAGARIGVHVTNTGERSGSTVVQVYAQAPEGLLSTPARELVAYRRTGTIEPGQSAEITLEIPLRALSHYDDSGITGHRSAWIVEPGEHHLLVGPDVRRAESAGTIAIDAPIVLEQLEEASAARHQFDRMTRRRLSDGTSEVAYEPVPQATVDLPQRILERLPEAIAGSNGNGAAPDGSHPDFQAVARGEVELDDFLATLDASELASLAYGDITMDSPLGAAGNAGALGGVTDALRARGIPWAVTTDGPSGLRLSAYASLLPCGTALASTWDPTMVRELAALHAQEMVAKGSDILLSPGVNIHRDPLCGRNFEYFSEDPLVTGTMGAAVVAGIQSSGRTACPKHFACKNQETARTRADSRLSERALREIYLRGFEICVKEAAPRTLMTSYNRVNGVWAHYAYDLVTTILRGQWGYEGVVVTDWWMQMAQDPHFPGLRDSAYRVRAQVDVLMPGSIEHGGTEREDAVLDSYRSEGGLTLGEMQRTARNVLRLLLEADLAARPLRDPGAARG